MSDPKLGEIDLRRNPERRRDGTVKKGSSLRAASFAKRARGLARLIGQETQNGQELIRLALEIARDAKHKDQHKAIEGLLRRYAGREPEAIDLQVSDGEGNALSPLAGLSLADILALAKQAPPKEE